MPCHSPTTDLDWQTALPPTSSGRAEAVVQGLRPVSPAVGFNFPVSVDPGCNAEHHVASALPGIRWIVVDFAEELNAICLQEMCRIVPTW